MSPLKTKPFDPAEYLDDPESIYRALSADGNPEFGTVMRVAQALGLRLSVTPTSDKAA
jgi:DNA-binding phage protein